MDGGTRPRATIARAMALFVQGDPHSVGHYIDLTSAVGGAVLFAAGVLLRVAAEMA